MSNRQPAVDPPEFRQPRRMDPLALFGRLAKRIGRLAKVVLEQPRLGEGAAQLQRFVARCAGLPYGSDEQGRGVRALSALERLGRVDEQVRRGHARQYSWYTVCRIEAFQTG